MEGSSPTSLGDSELASLNTTHSLIDLDPCAHSDSSVQSALQQVRTPGSVNPGPAPASLLLVHLLASSPPARPRRPLSQRPLAPTPAQPSAQCNLFLLCRAHPRSSTSAGPPRLALLPPLPPSAARAHSSSPSSTTRSTCHNTPTRARRPPAESSPRRSPTSRRRRPCAACRRHLPASARTKRPRTSLCPVRSRGLPKGGGAPSRACRRRGARRRRWLLPRTTVHSRRVRRVCLSKLADEKGATDACVAQATRP